MFHNILLAYDGSENSRRAAQIAGEMAREGGEAATLWLVCVEDVLMGELGEPFLSEAIQRRTIAGNARMAEAEAILGKDIDARRELMFGQPAESILEVARVRGCDLIIIGSRGLGLLQGLLLGSQSHKVISHAACPVLIVK